MRAPTCQCIVCAAGLCKRAACGNLCLRNASRLTSCLGYLYSLLFALKHIKPDDAELTDLAMKVALQIVKEGREKKYVSFICLSIPSFPVVAHLF